MAVIFPTDVFNESVDSAPQEGEFTGRRTAERAFGNESGPGSSAQVVRTLSDRSGPSGPWVIKRVPGASEGEDDKVSVGSSRTTRDYDTEDGPVTTILANGRSAETIGILMTRDMSRAVHFPDVDVEGPLWTEGGTDDAGNSISDSVVSGYETCCLCVKYDEDADVGSYVWLTAISLQDIAEEPLDDDQYDYYPLGWVTATKTNGDIPRLVDRIWGCTSASVIYPLKREGGGSSAVVAKTTGTPTNGEYPIALYADGKAEPSTNTGTAEVLNLSINNPLPTGTWIVVNKATVSITGGGTV